MEYENIEEKYKLNGLEDYRVNTPEDIYTIYGMDPLEIQGYANLTKENKEIYKRFIVNFFNSLSLEVRGNLKPLSFNDVEEIEFLGLEDPDDPEYIKILLHEIHVIESDGSKELVKRWEEKEGEMKITETIRNRYLRFEYKLYEVDEWIHVISDEAWY